MGASNWHVNYLLVLKSAEIDLLSFALLKGVPFLWRFPLGNPSPKTQGVAGWLVCVRPRLPFLNGWSQGLDIWNRGTWPGDICNWLLHENFKIDLHRSNFDLFLPLSTSILKTPAVFSYTTNFLDFWYHSSPRCPLPPDYWIFQKIVKMRPPRKSGIFGFSKSAEIDIFSLAY